MTSTNAEQTSSRLDGTHFI